MKNIKVIEDAIYASEGNIKHEDMYLNNGERELIRKKLNGQIGNEEFMKRVVEFHSKELHRG